MSQSGGPSSIGAISVDITANTAGLDAGLAKAKASATAAASDIGKAVGGGQGVKLFDQATIDQVTELENRLGELKQSGDGVAGSLTNIAAAATVAITALRVGLRIGEDLNRALGSGTDEAIAKLTKLGESVGTNVIPRLESVRSEMAQLEGELSKRTEQGWFIDLMEFMNDPRKYRSTSNLKEQLDELKKAEEGGSDQAKARRAREKDKEKRERSLEIQDRNNELLRGIREDERAKQKQIEDTAAQEQQIHDERLQRIEQIGKSNRAKLNPLEGIKDDTNEALRAVQQFRQVAQNDFERSVADSVERGIIEGSSRSAKALQEMFKNAFLDMLNQAMQDSQGAFGIRDMTVQLSQISRQIQVIQQTMPR